jgi:thiol-disulfide isomerase/thioredoxin
VANLLLQDPRPLACVACEKVVRCISTVAMVPERSPSLVAVCEQARLKALASARSAPTYDDARSRAGAIAFLESDLAKLAFFGRVAPTMDVRWSSDPGVRSLTDVRGKVVVLEFWSITCGPCVGNIPRMEQLKRDLAGTPVAFIAVTGAVQEDLSEPANPTSEQIESAADVLGKFMASKQMSGPVWVNAAGVFDPAYGVQGIPHVVILDGQGRVRASDLHPADTQAIRRAVAAAAEPVR